MSDISATIPPVAPTSNADPVAVAAAIQSPVSPITVAPASVPATVPVTSATAPNPTFARYATVLFTALIMIGSAAQILPAHHTTQDLVQFGIILAGAIGTVLSSVTTGPWPGIFKTGFASLAAIGTILIPYLGNGASFSSFTATNWIVIGVAVLNAVATEIGVDIRVKANAKVEENLLR